MDIKDNNFNITIKATRIPGVVELNPGQPAPGVGIFIPIDNKVGVCCNGYRKRLPDCGYTEGFLNDVELNLTAYAFKEIGESGCTHGLKPSLSSEMLQGMLKEQVRSIPWVGFVTPWNKKKGGKK